MCHQHLILLKSRQPDSFALCIVLICKMCLVGEVPPWSHCVQQFGCHISVQSSEGSQFVVLFPMLL